MARIFVCVEEISLLTNKEMLKGKGDMIKSSVFRCIILLNFSFFYPTITHAVNCTWPAYENTVRVWGQVYEVQPSGGHVITFTLVSWSDGTFVHFDCGYPANLALGCDLVSAGDSILVSGHQKDRTSCLIDGIDNYSVPNVIWKCIGYTAGTCIQLTPCL